MTIKFILHTECWYFSLTKSKYSGLWVMSDLEAALGRQSPWQHYHKCASFSAKGTTWCMKILKPQGKEFFLQALKKNRQNLFLLIFILTSILCSYLFFMEETQLSWWNIKLCKNSFPVFFLFCFPMGYKADIKPKKV